MSTEDEENHPYQNNVFKWLSFMLAVVSLPVFCMSYLTTSLGRFVLLRILRTMYPDLEFIKSVSIRSAMDTPNNMGFVVVLLKVDGECDIDLMKHIIQTDIVDKYDLQNKRPCFPHLRCSLTKKWMRYAWTTKSEFSIDNHVIGWTENKTDAATVSEENIMKYVNDIIATVIPTELPQWQITIIPAKDAFYLLVRIHHLYASEDGVGLSELLLLRPDDDDDDADGDDYDYDDDARWKRKVSSTAGRHADVDSIQNILSTVYQAPTAFPRLCEHLSEICANTWNELVSTYDPLENPKALGSRPNVFVFATMVTIAAASAAKDRTSGRDFARKLRRELARRNIRPRYFCQSVAHTFHPALWVSLSWWLTVNGLFRLPITLLLMVRNTSTCVYWTYVVLYTVSELLYMARLIYNAPSTIIRELVLPFFSRAADDGGAGLDRLQPLSGNKYVCWSGRIDQRLVSTIHDNTGAATCEIQLSMLAAALQEYFALAGVRFADRAANKNVMTTTRFVAKANLFRLNNRHVITNGLLSLPLPMDTDQDPIYSLHKMQECLQEAIANQTGLYIASMWQIDHSLATSFLPSPVVSYGLGYLSKKYPLTVTYVEENKLDKKKRRLLWGQRVDAIMYWRPPQANVCLSLTMMNYGGHLRLAVMADAKMAPLCNTIVSKYEQNVQAFVSAAEEYAKIVNTLD